MEILIGFDIRAKELVGVRAEKGAGREERLRTSEPVFTEKYFAQCGDLLSGYAKREADVRGKAAYVVLPNEAVGFETFDLPNMPRYKMKQALDAELNNLYEGRQKTRRINQFLIRKGKEFATYGAFFADGAIIDGVNKMLAAARLAVGAVTFGGNALLNGAFAYMPKTRGKSFVFADIGAEQTEIALSVHGKTLGYARIPHGFRVLEAEEVLSEYAITDHESGELAVINARESARDKALTVAADETDTDDEEAAEDTAAAEGAEGEGGERAAAGESAGGTESAGGEQAAPKLKIYRKSNKRYPKYMQRPVPETAEGVRFENFRILQKWIMLYARQMRLTEYAAAPEFILVNIPKEYYGVLETANAEAANGDKFTAFAAADELGAVKGHLPLFGALHAKKFNRDGNF